MKVIQLFFVTIVVALDKLCINCKHFKNDIFTPSTYAKCKKFPIIDNNVDYLIDGKKTKKTENIYHCSTARSSTTMCGEEGKYYEFKH
jgi:hypothetical protein